MAAHALLVEEKCPKTSISYLGAFLNGKHLDFGPLTPDVHLFANHKNGIYFAMDRKDPATSIVYSRDILVKDLGQRWRKVCERPPGELTDLVEHKGQLTDVLVQLGMYSASSSTSLWQTGTNSVHPGGIHPYLGNAPPSAMLHLGNLFTFRRGAIQRNGCVHQDLVNNQAGFQPNQYAGEEFTSLGRNEQTLLAATNKYRLFDIVNKLALKTLPKPPVMAQNSVPAKANVLAKANAEDTYALAGTGSIAYYAVKQDKNAIYGTNYQAKHATLSHFGLPEQREVTRFIIVPQTVVEDPSLQKGLF